jgi:hypothetical protein
MTDWNTPRLSLRLASLAKNPSTALSQEHEVGVKWNDALGDLRPERRDARGARLVAQQPFITLLHEAFLPAPDTGFRFAGLAHDLIGPDAIGAQQHNLGPPDMLLCRVSIPGERFQAAAITGLESNGNSGSHGPDSHVSSPTGIPSRIQMSDLIH